MVQISTEFYTAGKKNEIVTFTGKCMELELSVALREVARLLLKQNLDLKLPL